MLPGHFSSSSVSCLGGTGSVTTFGGNFLRFLGAENIHSSQWNRHLFQASKAPALRLRGFTLTSHVFSKHKLVARHLCRLCLGLFPSNAKKSNRCRRRISALHFLGVVHDTSTWLSFTQATMAKNECKCCQSIAGSHHSSNYPQQMSLIFAMLMQLRWFPQILSCKVEARSKTSPSQPRSASYPRSTWWWFLSSHCLLMISPGCCRHNVTTLKPTRIIGSLWITGQIIRSVGFWNAKSASKAKPTNSTVSPTCSVASWSQLRRTTAPKPKTSKTSKTSKTL